VITGNDLFVGYAKLNNANGSTTSGTQITMTPPGGSPETVYVCGDYDNTPTELNSGATWNAFSRYSKITISEEAAKQIARVSGNSIITFRLICAIQLSGATCDSCHSNITWIRITNSDGQVVYNGCPVGNIATIDVCVPISPTPTPTTSRSVTPTPSMTATTSVTITPTQTPTPTPTSIIAPPPGCHEYVITNECNYTITYSYYDCNGFPITGQTITAFGSVSICNNNDYGNIVVNESGCATITYIGACPTYYYYDASSYSFDGIDCNPTLQPSVVLRSDVPLNTGDWVCANDFGNNYRYYIDNATGGPSYDYTISGGAVNSCLSLNC